MRMPFGKHKGLEISALPEDYLKWLVQTIDPGDVKDEAKRVLDSGEFKQEQKYSDLEAEANRILGEKPVDLLKRGYGKPRRRL
jgi:hypothetical protein